MSNLGGGFPSRRHVLFDFQPHRPFDGRPGSWAARRQADRLWISFYRVTQRHGRQPAKSSLSIGPSVTLKSRRPLIGRV